MRCPRCGNENPDQNRFCGMCGATLLAAPEAPAAQPQRVATAATPAPAKESAVTRAQVSEPPRAPLSDSTPSISGPSFLGLNDPGPRQRASLSVDGKGGTSRNLDYLLEDEGEHHESSGAGKFLLILVALALAAGLGYLRWRHQGSGWLGLSPKPSAATQPASDSTSSSPAPTTQPSAVAQPATPPPADSTSPPTNSATLPAPVNPAPSMTPAASADTAKPADNTTSAPATPDNTTAPASKDSASTAKQPSPATSPATADSTDEPKPAPAQPAAKPPAAKPVATVDPVAEAQKYLYGRGVTQDCDRGMRYLKPAANQGNPKAMIEMGALYSAGLCTPHDLPTAYRWFALALRKNPDNQDVQTDLQKLWGEMTQPERQLAIKLTQ